MEFVILYPESIEIMGEDSLAYCREKFEVEKVNSSILSIMCCQEETSNEKKNQYLSDNQESY